jgi:hypothetical protein
MDQQGDHSKIAPGASQSRALADVDVDESSQSADDFLASAEHPTYQRPYTELSFVPMIELLEFLCPRSRETPQSCSLKFPTR